MKQLSLLPELRRPESQLLKWIGNKFRYANKIVCYFPPSYNKYIEPFVGTGSILATLSPEKAMAGDTLSPLIEFWKVLQDDPQRLIDYYASTVNRFTKAREKTYNEIKEKFNKSPNGLDLLIISRTCYGGVVRFTREGTISTPIGSHRPIPPEKFALRVKEWRGRVKNAVFLKASFAYTMSLAEKGDLIYCDPPYVDSQSILYGAQDFKFEVLLHRIELCKNVGAKVALSIDGRKKSGKKQIELEIPSSLFEREIYLNCGSSMLKRFQNGGKTMIGENVYDRLLLTW